MKQFQQVFPWLLLVALLINLNGLFNDILEPDGALYATIAKRMVLTGDWFNLWALGGDWLDKPHFPFWVTALSFKFFGIGNFTYKLPAFIFWLAGVYYTYKIALHLYDRTTARAAVVIYVFALHGILNNFDVRAEPYLTTLIIAAIYYFYKAQNNNQWKWIFLTALFAGCAIMTKGIFVLLTIGGGFVLYWLLTKQYRQFVNYRWWIMMVLILVCIMPELYSLYMQFDMHPEKLVFSKTGVSGIRFFFWDSQFGRFFNTGPITGRGDVTFFVHSTLWAFLPWSFLLAASVAAALKGLKESGCSLVIGGSAALTFMVFSLSKFQLPHYIVILFPHFAILTSRYVVSITKNKTLYNWRIVQVVLLIIGALFVVFLSFYTAFGAPAWVIIIAVVILLPGLLLYKKGMAGVLVPSAALMLLMFIYLHNFFYPHLLPYQAGVAAGRWMHDNEAGNTAALINAPSAFSFEFNAPGIVERIPNEKAVEEFSKDHPTGVLYVSEKEMVELSSLGYHFTILKTFPYFHISMLTPAFLNPASRAGTLQTVALIKLNKYKINDKAIDQLKQKMMDKLSEARIDNSTN